MKKVVVYLSAASKQVRVILAPINGTFAIVSESFQLSVQAPTVEVSCTTRKTMGTSKVTIRTSPVATILPTWTAHGLLRRQLA